jgi:hypothetical protein
MSRSEPISKSCENFEMSGWLSALLSLIKKKNEKILRGDFESRAGLEFAVQRTRSKKDFNINFFVAETKSLKGKQRFF